MRRLRFKTLEEDAGCLRQPFDDLEASQSPERRGVSSFHLQRVKGPTLGHVDVSKFQRDPGGIGCSELVSEGSGREKVRAGLVDPGEQVLRQTPGFEESSDHGESLQRIGQRVSSKGREDRRPVLRIEVILNVNRR